jgi:hypothetical protein
VLAVSLTEIFRFFQENPARSFENLLPKSAFEFMIPLTAYLCELLVPRLDGMELVENEGFTRKILQYETAA